MEPCSIVFTHENIILYDVAKNPKDSINTLYDNKSIYASKWLEKNSSIYIRNQPTMA